MHLLHIVKTIDVEASLAVKLVNQFIPSISSTQANKTFVALAPPVTPIALLALLVGVETNHSLPHDVPHVMNALLLAISCTERQRLLVAFLRAFFFWRRKGGGRGLGK